MCVPFQFREELVIRLCHSELHLAQLPLARVFDAEAPLSLERGGIPASRLRADVGDWFGSRFWMRALPNGSAFAVRFDGAVDVTLSTAARSASCWFVNG